MKEYLNLNESGLQSPVSDLHSPVSGLQPPVEKTYDVITYGAILD